MGMEGQRIRVEVDASTGLPSYDTVGLPDKAIKESRERVRSAIRNSGYTLPPRRITVNLAPAGMKKVGSLYDLPIAIALMQANGILALPTPEMLDQSIFVGELALSGEIRPVHGVLPMAIMARKEGISYFFCPKENAAEASYIQGLQVIGVRDLAEICQLLEGGLPLPAQKKRDWQPAAVAAENDFCFIKGQLVAKRAAEIAAAGGHNMLMIGHPGGGKTMLARAMPGILPDLSFEEALEISQIYSILGKLDASGLVQQRPFVAPHHSVSMAALVGGGGAARPGEISLAHLGVLFLDEMPEFQRDALEGLRQPLEDGIATISRVHASSTYPARFMLVGAMNPCPCGYFGSKYHTCNCSEKRIQNYRKRLSGPLIDRIDMFVSMQELHYDDFHQKSLPSEDSAAIRQRVDGARKRQAQRLKDRQGIFCNGQMKQQDIEASCVLDAAAERFLAAEFQRQHFNGRTNARILRLSRTIADLDGVDVIQEYHVAEAIQYRQMDQIWT